MWKIAKASDLKEDWGKFRKIRQKLKSVLRKKYRCFVDNFGEMQKSNPKSFWSFFRNKTKSKSLPSKIQNDSAGSTDPQGKACLFNHFTSRPKCMPGSRDPGVTIVNPTEISVMYGYVT